MVVVAGDGHVDATLPFRHQLFGPTTDVWVLAQVVHGLACAERGMRMGGGVEEHVVS